MVYVYYAAALALVAGAVVKLNVWHKRYMASLTPAERAEIDRDIEESGKFW